MWLNTSQMVAALALVAISLPSGPETKASPATVEMTLEWTDNGTSSPFKSRLVLSAESRSSSHCTTVERNGANKWEFETQVRPVVHEDGQITVELQTMESKTSSGGISTGRYTRKATVNCTDNKPLTIYSFEITRDSKTTRNALILTARKL